MRLALIGLVALLWLGACGPRANSEPPGSGHDEHEPAATDERAVEPWLQIQEPETEGRPVAGEGPCATGPEDFDGFMDEDGCGDPDNDRDGIADVDDMCPNEPESFDGFEDQDGCPDHPPAQLGR